MTMPQIAAAIPHEIRQMILLEWLPVAKASMGNDAFKALYEAYFLYIDPDGVRKDNCPYCLENVLKNWKSMQKYLVDAEQEYNVLENLTI
jgi:hypothetical protein